MDQDRRWGLELLTMLSNPTAQRHSEDSRKESDTSLKRGTRTALKSSEKEKVGRGAPSRGRMRGEGMSSSDRIVFHTSPLL